MSFELLFLITLAIAVLLGMLFILSAFDNVGARRDVRELHGLLRDACYRCASCRGRQRYPLTADACHVCLPWREATARIGRRYGIDADFGA